MNSRLFLFALCAGVVLAGDVFAAPPTVDVSPGYDRRLYESRRSPAHATPAMRDRHRNDGRSPEHVSKSRVRKKRQ